MNGIDTDGFKRAMRALPAQVAVISAQVGDNRIAMTATAVTSLSAEPPQLLICVHKMARPAAVIIKAKAFAVNLVNTAQIDIATQCALPGLEPEERFKLGNWHASEVLDQPFLKNALVNFECRLVSQSEHGSHYVFVGLIEGLDFTEGSPLLYHEASYRSIGKQLNA